MSHQNQGVLTICTGKLEIPVGKSNGSRYYPFGKLQKIWAVIRGDAIFLLFEVSLADVDILYNNSGFSLTFEVEGHWLVSRHVLCKTEGQGPKPLGGPGGKIFRT